MEAKRTAIFVILAAVIALLCSCSPRISCVTSKQEVAPGDTHIHISPPTNTSNNHNFTGMLIVGCDEGLIYALNSRTGEICWKFEIPSLAFPSPLRTPILSAVAWDDLHIFAAASYTSKVFVIEKASGKALSVIDINEDYPEYLILNESNMYYLSRDGALSRYDFRKKKHDEILFPDDNLVCRPLLLKNYMFVCFSTKISALNLDTHKLEWDYPLRSDSTSIIALDNDIITFAGSAPGASGLQCHSGDLLWNNAKVMRGIEKAVSLNGAFCFLSCDSVLCLSSDNGKILWKVDSPIAESKLSSNVSICAAGKYVIIASLDGVHALDSQNGDLVWTWRSEWDMTPDNEHYITRKWYDPSHTVTFGVVDNDPVWECDNLIFHSNYGPYCGAGYTIVTCLDLRTGKERWRTNLSQIITGIYDSRYQIID